MITFEYMMALPEWHCRIGRLTLKPGVRMLVPYDCTGWWD